MSGEPIEEITALVVAVDRYRAGAGEAAGGQAMTPTCHPGAPLVGSCPACDPGICRHCARNLGPDDHGDECADHVRCHICHGEIGEPCPEHYRPTCSDCCGCEEEA